MRVALLRHVRHHIAEHPERFCAANWAWAANVREVLEDGEAPESFRCCIAGHVLLCAGRFDEPTLLRYSVRFDDGFVGRCAREALGGGEREQRALFYPTQWPEPYRQAYYLAQTRLQEAQAAVGVLDAFIALLSSDAPKAGGELRPPQQRAARTSSRLIFA